MNSTERVLIIDGDGRLFAINPPHEFLIPLADSSSFYGSKRLIRVSSCDWCFWSVSSEFEVNLYVYKRDVPIEVAECTFENERRAPIGIKEFSPIKNTTEKGRDRFSSEDGKISLPKESFLLPSFNWIWTSDWFVKDFNDHCGWKYALNFNSEFRSHPLWYTNVRRRKWVRKRMFVPYERFIQIDSPLTCDFVNDIAISSCSLDSYPKGFICVWIVSNSGRLFFKENVSFENPEGTEWREVYLPNQFKALSISCSNNGTLWVVTYEGQVFLREIKNTSEPWGTEWVPIHSNERFVQITSNSVYVFALNSDNCVFMYLNQNWIKVLKDLCFISISSSNKLWGISKSKRTIYIGTKLELMESRLFNWKSIESPIQIDAIDAKTALDDLEDLSQLKFFSIL